MGSGKNRLGEKLARVLQRKVCDTDRMIEDRFHLEIPEIFSRYGEDFFRKEEAELLRNITQENLLIITGGGLPCFHGNMHFMKQNGYSVYLKVPPSVLFGRLREKKNRDKRPLLAKKTDSELKQYIEQTLAEREKFYLEADYVFDTSEHKAEILKKHLLELNPIS